jgi:hypothetical protein
LLTIFFVEVEFYLDSDWHVPRTSIARPHLLRVACINIQLGKLSVPRKSYRRRVAYNFCWGLDEFYVESQTGTSHV